MMEEREVQRRTNTFFFNIFNVVIVISETEAF